MRSRHAPESQSETTRQRIIDAANALFGRVGYRRATTRAIAAAAGVNEVTIFRHFGSKRNLLRASIEYAAARTFPATFDHLLTGDYAQDILAMARAQRADMQQGADALRVLMCDAGEAPEVREYLQAAARRNFARLTAYFQAQIDAGIVRADLDAETAAYAFDNLFSTAVFVQRAFDAESPANLPEETRVRQLADLFVRATAA